MTRRMTLEQIEKMQPHSAAGFRYLQDDDELADEVEDMTPEEFADWRGIEIIENPPKRALNKGENIMPTIRELRAELREKDSTISDLEDELQELRDTLAEIRGLATTEDDDEEDSEAETDEEED